MKFLSKNFPPCNLCRRFPQVMIIDNLSSTLRRWREEHRQVRVDSFRRQVFRLRHHHFPKPSRTLDPVVRSSWKNSVHTAAGLFGILTRFPIIAQLLKAGCATDEIIANVIIGPIDCQDDGLRYNQRYKRRMMNVHPFENF